MITTLVFDLDDTLYRELDFVHGAFYEVARFMIEQKLVWINADNSVQHLHQEMITLLESEGRGKIFDRLIDKYAGDRKNDISVPELVRVYRQAKPNLSLYKDAIEVLQWAKQESYSTGIITDGAATVQHNKIGGLGVAQVVDIVMVTYDLGEEFSKPHAKPYEEVLRKLDINPQEAIYIGDNPHKDFIGARKLGINTVRIIRDCGDHMQTRLDDEHEADYEITHLMELPKVIQQINDK